MLTDTISIRFDYANQKVELYFITFFIHIEKVKYIFKCYYSLH